MGASARPWARLGVLATVAVVALDFEVGELVLTTRYSSVIRDLYLWLLTAGKPKLIALTARVHELLLILNANARVRHQTVWDPVAP